MTTTPPLNHWPHDLDGCYRCCDAALEALTEADMQAGMPGQVRSIEPPTVCPDCGRSEADHLTDDECTALDIDTRDGLGCAIWRGRTAADVERTTRPATVLDRAALIASGRTPEYPTGAEIRAVKRARR